MSTAGVVLIAALVSCAQPGAEPPRYEVASIKPRAGYNLPFAFRIEPDGSLAATGITLKRLMTTAYNVQDFRIVGGPGWLAFKRWDVQAKPGRAMPANQIRPALRALLEDRFRLRVHAEKRNRPVYELMVEGKGSKVPRVRDGETKEDVRVGAGLIELKKATAATFASQLSYALGRPVIDRTNLSGEFDFALEWTPELGDDSGPGPAAVNPTSTVGDGPSLFTAIREQLGLRLKSARGLVEVIVIDSVGLPTAN